jgi:HSP20 family protein
MAWLPWKRSRESGGEHPIARFRREMDRMLDEFGRGFLPSWEGISGPALDVRETESEVIVDVEVPGLGPADLDVSVTESVLTVKGEKKSERDEKEGDYHLTERSYGSFVRTVQLPAAVDSAKAEATHRNGVVTITLPKTDKGKGRKIEIK